MKFRNNYAVALIFLLFVLSIACHRFRLVPNGPHRDVNVALPRNTKHAESDTSSMTSVVVSVPTETDFYVGKKKVPLDDLDDQIGESLKGSAAPEKIVYLAAGEAVSHGTIVRVADEIRKKGVFKIACIVNQAGSSESAPGVFKLEIPSEPDPNQDLSRLKPNPMMLVVSIAPDLKVKLNQEETGTVNDPLPLQQFLDRIFRQRKEQHAYNPALASRSDLTEEERVEKTIVIKADKSVTYGDVIRVIDAVKGTYANPIILQIDETMIFFLPD